jgi:hypothetical protein
MSTEYEAPSLRDSGTWDRAAFPTLKRGANKLSVPGRWFTKQTGDMVYTFAENSWLSQLWLDA